MLHTYTHTVLIDTIDKQYTKIHTLQKYKHRHTIHIQELGPISFELTPCTVLRGYYIVHV